MEPPRAAFTVLALIGVWILTESPAYSVDYLQSTSLPTTPISERPIKLLQETSGDSGDQSTASEYTGENSVRNGDNDAPEDDTVQKSDTDSSDEDRAKNEDSGDESDSTIKNDGVVEEKDEETQVKSKKKSDWATQADESASEVQSPDSSRHTWKLCNVTAGQDYVPCLDNWQTIRRLPDTMHYEHRERHCPDTPPTCLVPLPKGYKRPIAWPTSREKIWFDNIPSTKLAEFKGHQNWVKATGDHLVFPGGGTQFVHGALHYIDFIQEALPGVEWGKKTRVILDVGCGVASFGGFLFERNVLAMSLAPKDEHEAQVQFALERGIPAILAVMGTRRLPFSSSVFDMVHCARCRVPWHAEHGKLLLELNRLLRPGGFFVWSATPLYQKLPVDVEIWEAMKILMESMCWKTLLIKKDEVNNVAVAVYQKPTDNDCYDSRDVNEPPMCDVSDNADAAWNIKLKSCMHRVPEKGSLRGAKWPKFWPERLEKVPYWLKSVKGVYGKTGEDDFRDDSKHWKNVVKNSYLKGLELNISSMRNVMDMRAVYGGFAAALKDLEAWVMNIVPIDSPDTLPVIYERGLFGMYHDWCESFNSYPRTYDLLHADHLFSAVKQRCNILSVIAEVDRLLRPEGNLIVRDEMAMINEMEAIAKSLHWEVKFIYSKDEEGLLCVKKTKWRPKESEIIWSSIM